MPNVTEPSNSFEALRKMVFNLKPQEIGLTKDNFDHIVWGVIMETGFDSGSFSLVTLADGTASLYLSTGGGTIGAGEHEAVRTAVGHYLTGAQHFVVRARPVDKYPLPLNGNVTFYFLTFDGISAYSAAEDKLGNGDDDFSDLFYAAHTVITEIREIEEK